MLLSHRALFHPIDLKRRTFRKALRPGAANGVLFTEAAPAAAAHEPSNLAVLRDEAVLAALLAQIVVTADGVVAVVNRQAEFVFGVSTRDIRRPSAISTCPTGRSSCAGTSRRPMRSGVWSASPA